MAFCWIRISVALWPPHIQQRRQAVHRFGMSFGLTQCFYCTLLFSERKRAAESHLGTTTSQRSQPRPAASCHQRLGCTISGTNLLRVTEPTAAPPSISKPEPSTQSSRRYPRGHDYRGRWD
ncbi:hypothetical protein B0H19DRAFT_709721 [Mycena capillaripes]|nr:hypothetical protein B0H19DRAFT_709721 [Mycena capillaripes]